MKWTIFLSISILLVCGIVRGDEPTVFWIQGVNMPDFSRVPLNPTTEDLISITVPTDVFPNQSIAENALGGSPTITVDPVRKEIELRFVGPVNDYPVNTPVSGLEGHFGPLEEGSWFLDVRFQGTI